MELVWTILIYLFFTVVDTERKGSFEYVFKQPSWTEKYFDFPHYFYPIFFGEIILLG